ncbi:MAG: NDP-sugar synthase [Nitriliruptor sp.]
MTVREACIVAGGAGTRLRPLTATTPKPLLPFCGVPFLAGVLERLAGVGVERVLLVVGADPSPFEVLRDGARELGIDLEAVPEPEPLDTAGGVRAALDRMSGTFLVLNGDILTDVPLAPVIDAHRAAGAAATLVLTRVEDTSSFGVCVREGDRITAFVEKPAPGELPGQDAVNAGTYVLEPEALARFEPGRLSFERDVFPGLVADGLHVEGYVSGAVWADLGTPGRYLAGHRLALGGALAWPPLEAVPDRGGGVRIADDVHLAPGTRLVGPLLLRPGVRVGAGARVGPHVVAGDRTVIGPGADVTDSVLADDVVIDGDTSVAGLLAGRGARVGSGTVLGRDVVLGDGVTLEPGSRVPDGARIPGGEA